MSNIIDTLYYYYSTCQTCDGKRKYRMAINHFSRILCKSISS